MCADRHQNTGREQQAGPDRAVVAEYATPGSERSEERYREENPRPDSTF